MSTEDTLRSWAQRPSNSEQDRIERTERMIRSALEQSDDDQVKNARIFAKGSVRMRTNVKTTSDIDICVEAKTTFYADYPGNKTHEDFGNTSSDYTFSEFRQAVEQALISSFGSHIVDITGNKAIRINADISSTRIDADVVPAFVHRRYSDNTYQFEQGIELRPKNNFSQRIVNWPEQNYQNSLRKHENTYRRYRKMARIIKRLRNLMKEQGLNVSKGSDSFLIESLLWNVPIELYGNNSYYDDLIGIFDFLKTILANNENVKEWGEVNELKYLFNSHQKWTREDALDFITKADGYLRNNL